MVLTVLLAVPLLSAPFASLPEPGRTPVFAGLFGLLVLASGVMWRFGQVPKTPEAPLRIVSFELAGTLERAQQILDSWRKVDGMADIRAAFQIGADFLFILAYAPLMALLVYLGGEALGEAWILLAGLVAWGQLGAGLFDMVENIGLMQVLLGAQTNRWAAVAAWSARIKIGLLFAGVPLAVIGLVSLVCSWFR